MTRQVSFSTYDNSNQVEFFTGECRNCGSLRRYYPEWYSVADSDVPADAFDCCAA